MIFFFFFFFFQAEDGIRDLTVTGVQTCALPICRLTIDKRFHGDLEGISKGEMLALQTETKGSAGYVALERVTGKLKGRSGSFVLQHSATMNRGDSRAEISVVPDSASGEL